MREVSINMAEKIRETARKGDTLEPRTPSHAFSKRSTANARIMAEIISTEPTGHSVGHSRNLADRAVFHFYKRIRRTE